jgi:hypothetical protein
VWLVARGGSIAARGFVHETRERRLSDLAPTIRVLLGLDRDPHPLAGFPIAALFEGPSVATL